MTTRHIHHQYSCGWNLQTNTSQVHSLVLDFCAQDIKNQNGMFWCEIYDDVFLHLRAGSNWERLARNIHDTRTQQLETLLNNLITASETSVWTPLGYDYEV